jgi:hypothetical protein
MTLYMSKIQMITSVNQLCMILWLVEHISLAIEVTLVIGGLAGIKIIQIIIQC